jgi:hypothetical protein
VGGGTAEVALGGVVRDGLGNDARGVCGGVFAVDLEGFAEGVGGVVRLGELRGLDGGGFFKGLACFVVWRMVNNLWSKGHAPRSLVKAG